MSKRSAQKTAIVTGGANRIGAAIARELHDMGMDVVIHFKSSTTAASTLVQKLNAARPDSAHLLQSDLREPDGCRTLIEQVYAINKRVDVLINNASVFYPTSLQEFTTGDWDELMSVNLKAPLFLAQAAAPYLAQTRGSIINLADIYADQPLGNHIIYNISKAGLIMLTKSLAKELGPDVRVNAISPGVIFWHDNMNESEKNGILESTILKQQGNAKDISNAVRYLIDDADYTTGQVLVIDGGRTLCS
jgi:pteridine reductase